MSKDGLDRIFEKDSCVLTLPGIQWLILYKTLKPGEPSKDMSENQGGSMWRKRISYKGISYDESEIQPLLKKVKASEVNTGHCRK